MAGEFVPECGLLMVHEKGVEKGPGQDAFGPLRAWWRPYLIIIWHPPSYYSATCK
jgi:hypothetical protein